MPEKLPNARDLYLHLLAEALYVERRLAGEVLQDVIRQAQDEELVEALEHHLEQTREHVARAEQAFRLADAEPSAARSAPFEALVAEHGEVAPLVVLPQAADVFHAAAAAHTEHFELAVYGALVELARALDQPEAATLFERTLKEEQAALKLVAGVLPRLARRAAGT